MLHLGHILPCRPIFALFATYWAHFTRKYAPFPHSLGASGRGWGGRIFFFYRKTRAKGWGLNAKLNKHRLSLLLPPIIQCLNFSHILVARCSKLFNVAQNSKYTKADSPVESAGRRMSWGQILGGKQLQYFRESGTCFFLSSTGRSAVGFCQASLLRERGSVWHECIKCCRVSFLTVISGFHFPASRVASVTINLPAPSKYTLQCNAYSDPFFLGYQKPKISIDHDRIEEKKVKEKGFLFF